MNKLSLTLVFFCFLCSEVNAERENAGILCNCKYSPLTCTLGNFQACLLPPNTTNCEEWGLQQANGCNNGNLECTQIGTCSN